MARRVGAFGAALALALLAGCVTVARGAEHELLAGPKTTHFGGWSAAQKGETGTDDRSIAGVGD